MLHGGRGGFLGVLCGVFFLRGLEQLHFWKGHVARLCLRFICMNNMRRDLLSSSLDSGIHEGRDFFFCIKDMCLCDDVFVCHSLAAVAAAAAAAPTTAASSPSSPSFSLMPT